MTASRWMFVGAILGGLSVILGAFAAHGLKGRFAELSTGEFQAREIFDVAVRYHAIHALSMLFAAGLIDKPATRRMAAAACWAFLVGVILFSGSLYLLGTTGVRSLGAITPFGGLAFIGGWALLAIAALRSNLPAL